MEGPSLIILKEQLNEFRGKIISHASGLSRVPYEPLKGKKIKFFKTWGKHFLIVLPGFAIRIHFLMFGSYRINERKDAEPSLALRFAGGRELNFYTSAVRLLEGSVNNHYDWSVDVMSDSWNARAARKKLRQLPEMSVSDALLDQQIFSGVGNIIKNEVLFRIGVHPDSTVAALPPRKLSALVHEARNYSFDFYKWKKVFQLKKHWLIFTKKKCGRCELPTIKKYTGTTKRRSFYCSNCQKLYANV